MVLSQKRRRELISFAQQQQSSPESAAAAAATTSGGATTTTNNGVANTANNANHEPVGAVAVKLPRRSTKVFWGRDAFFSRVSVRYMGVRWCVLLS